MDSSGFKRAGDVPILQCGLYPLLLMIYCSLCKRSAANTADQLPEWISATVCEGERTQKQALDYAISGGAAIYSQLSHLHPPSPHPPQLYPEIPLFAATLQKLFPRHLQVAPSSLPPRLLLRELEVMLLPFYISPFPAPPFQNMRDGFFSLCCFEKGEKTLAIVAQVWFSQVPFWFELL